MSKATTLTDDLTDKELDRLSLFLDELPHSMNLEVMDGFFSALICAPEHVPMGEVFSMVWGEELEFESYAEAQEITALIMRHWNAISRALSGDDLYYPLLLENEAGIATGNDWAQGFYRGMALSGSWAKLLDDDEHGGWIVPILVLAHEHDPDPEMRPDNLEEKREEILVGVVAGLKKIHEYFAPLRVAAARQQAGIVRSGPKVGRNDPCPCGSGRKYKQCCIDKKISLH